MVSGSRPRGLSRWPGVRLIWVSFFCPGPRESLPTAPRPHAVAEAAPRRVAPWLAQPGVQPGSVCSLVSLRTGAPASTGGLSTEPRVRVLSGLPRRGLPARSPRGGPASKTVPRCLPSSARRVVPEARVHLPLKGAFCVREGYQLRTHGTRSRVILKPSPPACLPALGLSCGRWLSPPSGTGSSQLLGTQDPSGNPEPSLCGPLGVSGLHTRHDGFPPLLGGPGRLSQRSSCCCPGVPAWFPHPDLPTSGTASR